MEQYYIGYNDYYPAPNFLFGGFSPATWIRPTGECKHLKRKRMIGDKLYKVRKKDRR